MSDFCSAQRYALAFKQLNFIAASAIDGAIFPHFHAALA